MRKNPIILVLIGLLFVGITSCKKVSPSPTPTTTTTTTTPSAGTTDFTKYVAVGNSLTAGLTNGGLYNAGMQYSFPNLLATQFVAAGGGTFTQPTFDTGQENGSGFLKLTSTTPTIVSETSSLAVIGTGADNARPLLAKYASSSTLNNLGVPGLSLAAATTAGYGFNNAAGFNQYFERLLGTSDATSSYADFITAQASSATFFSCWLGGNDVLGYATTGGNAVDSKSPITPTALFEANLKTILDKFSSAKGGIMLSIPKITLAAYFKTVTLTTLQAALEKGGAPANSAIYITTGAGAVRAATSTDLFLLGADAQTAYALLSKTTAGLNNGIPYGLHPNNPLESKHVLDVDEVTTAEAAVTAFNTILSAEATSRGLAYVDINTLLTEASTTGHTANGITYSTAYITGGIFSLDGIHLTPAGNAVVTNEIIKAINTKYGSTLTELNNALFNSLTLSQ